MLGMRVCYSHGGASPQARRAASERLRDLLDPALDGLARALDSEDIRAVLRASELVLDRTGYGPRAEFAVENRVAEFRERYKYLLWNALSEAAKRRPDARGPELVRTAAALLRDEPPPPRTKPEANWTH